MQLFINWTVLSGKILFYTTLLVSQNHALTTISSINNYHCKANYRVCLNILPANVIKISNLTIDLICLLLISLPKTFSVEILMKNC